MPATNTFANNLLNRLFRGTAYPSKPTTLYFGLLTAPPSSSVGTGFTEVSTSGTGYQRAAIAVNNTTNFVVGTGGGGNGIDSNRVTNAVEILFNRSTNVWGSISHVAIFSGATGNNMLAWFEMPGGAVTVGNATRFRFEQYKLDIGFDPSFVGDTLALAWLNHVFRNETWTLTGNIWLALANATTNTGITEIGSANGYTRGGGSANTPATADDGFAIGTGTWNAAANGETYNTSALCMPTSTGAWEGGAVIPRFALMTALSGGNVLLHGPLATGGAIVSTTGIGLSFAAGSGNGLNLNIVG